MINEEDRYLTRFHGEYVDKQKTTNKKKKSGEAERP